MCWLIMADRKRREGGLIMLGWCLTDHHDQCWQMIPAYTCACACHGVSQDMPNPLT